MSQDIAEPFFDLQPVHTHCLIVFRLEWGEREEEVHEEVRLWPPSQGRQARYGGGWSFVP